MMDRLKNLRCVVLGGGGFIGTNLCLRLVGRVKALKAFGRRQNFPGVLSDVEWIPGDLNDAIAVAAAVDGCDVVFHLAWSTTPAQANLDKIADLQNVTGTLRLLETCRAAKVRRVVFASSGGTVYGIPDRIPTSENEATWPITAYGISKLAVERYLNLFRYLHNLDYRILRIANPFGPYQVAAKMQGVIAAFLKRALAGETIEVWGDGTVRRDYIFIDDLTEALEMAAVHEGHDRLFNIGSGTGRSVREIIESIQDTVGIQLKVRYLEGRPVDVPVSILDIERARIGLGWTPQTEFLEGLEKTAMWMRSDIMPGELLQNR